MTATEEWNARLAELRADGLKPDEAVKRLVHEDPELHKAYLAEANQGRET